MANITADKGVYFFKPSGKTCNLSIYEKYPELCKNIGLLKEYKEGQE